MHLSLAKERYLKGLTTEQWAERYPDHFVVIHDHEALAFTETLSQTSFQLDEAALRRIHEEQVFVFFISGPVPSEGALVDVETHVNLIQEKLKAENKEKALAELNEALSPADWQKILIQLIRTNDRELFAAVKDVGLRLDEIDRWMAEKVFHDMEKAFPDGVPMTETAAL